MHVQSACTLIPAIKVVQVLARNLFEVEKGVFKTCKARNFLPTCSNKFIDKVYTQKGKILMEESVVHVA